MSAQCRAAVTLESPNKLSDILHGFVYNTVNLLSPVPKAVLRDAWPNAGTPHNLLYRPSDGQLRFQRELHTTMTAGRHVKSSSKPSLPVDVVKSEYKPA
jgi:hypothetical protein